MIDFLGNPSQGTSLLFQVTASVDSLEINWRVRMNRDLQLQGCVSWTGRSSMEIRMSLRSTDKHGRPYDEEDMESYFTFVARDATTGKAAPIKVRLVGLGTRSY